MCGITGIVALNKNGESHISKIETAVKSLSKRGPDSNGIYLDGNFGLGHARLSILDTSSAGNQPLTDDSGRYTIVYNGEFYNFEEHRKELISKGISFKSTSDTEVLLNLYISDGEKCLNKINGFFAFAIYDKEDNSIFIARDRMGIKPLLIYQDNDKIIFGSEMKALLSFDIEKNIDRASLFTYLQLNYIPAPHSILENVTKLEAGSYLFIKSGKVEKSSYYSIPYEASNINKPNEADYESSKKKLHSLLETSIQKRLVSDVPLGTFLSGGIDSSIITSVASKHIDNINSFSIGYKDEPFYDETLFAELVAKKAGTNHTVFKLTNQDLLENVFDVLDYIDEPFADSSAIAVYILSKLTREHISVSLSGDGADEMFSGYNKHMAEYKARNPGIIEHLVKGVAPVFKKVPQSRGSKLSNLARQVEKFSTGAKLNNKNRYWSWASILDEEGANYILKEITEDREQRLSDDGFSYKKRKEALLKSIHKQGGINDVLYTDMHMVLQNDMLTKVDMMSMANSLEVRTPFLDHNVVNFAFQLPAEYKINSQMRKKILIEAFQEYLPDELLNRSKHGFEVPMLKWFQNELKSLITDDLLSNNFIEEQGIFNVESIIKIKNKLFSNNPGDTPATIWALIVFQYWWRKHFINK